MNKNLEEALKILTKLEGNIGGRSSGRNIDEMELSRNILLVKDLIEGQLVVNKLRSEYVISTTEMGMVNNKNLNN
jgi:hypothetical protein